MLVQTAGRPSSSLGSRTSSPTSATTSPSSACTPTAGSRSAACPRTARSIARSTCCGKTASSTRRTAPVVPRTDSATRRTGWSCGRTAAQNVFASDIAYHLSKRERGFEQLVDILGADHHGSLHACARVSSPWGSRGQPRGPAPAVRNAVSRRREGADVDALGRVRDAREPRAEVGNDAAFFYVMRSNDQHLDFDLELAKSPERQPRLLHPVRACAGVQRDAPARGEGARVRRRAGPRVAVASPSRTSSRSSPRSAAIRK